MEQQRNPFELMMNPAAILEAVERSTRLASLHSRIYRPLDAPAIRKKREDDALERDVELTDESSDESTDLS